MVMNNNSGPFSLPPSTSVPQGSGGRYAKKYVRIPQEVARATILPAAADAAAQTMARLSLPKGQRRARYLQLVSQFYELAVRLYLTSNNETSVTPQGILEAAQANPALRSG